MTINILTKGPQLVTPEDVAVAAALEASIINHCRANYYGFMDAERHDKLKRVETVAQERYDILMEMLP